MIETGTVLQQRYRIDKQIGQGGMGAVYVATDERFGSVVAIKETLLMDDSYRKAIEREARLLNSLKHSALPRVSDHFHEENGQFLVMEYIPGEDLGHMMENDHESFPVAKVLDWADQLLDALEFLHTQSIPVIHRDIKPQNLKLTARGQIILLDFGLAKGNPTDAGHQTAAKSIFGYSRNYASLEQIQGTGTDPRSDLYSLAATLYHLLTGVPPEDALTRAMSVLSEQPDSLAPSNSLRKDIPPGVAGILHRAMDLNAALRPASAREMRQMLVEHEKYAGPARSTAAPAQPSIADLSAQPTKLMPGDTRKEGGNLSDIKTRTDDVYISQETKIKETAGARLFTSPSENIAGLPNNNAAKTRSRVAVAGVLALLVIACGGVLGAYVYNPGLFGVNSGKVAEDNKNIPVAAPEVPGESQANSDPGVAVTDSSGMAANGTAQVEKPKEPNATSKIIAPVKPSKSAANGKQTASGDDEPGMDDTTVYTGNMRIKNGTIITPDTIIDENGVRRRIPPVTKTPGGPLFNRQQLRNMTPEQRRKMKIFLQNKPQPYPTPPE